ncbi:MAG: monovalent cation/H+ antiporter complex subunit F [Thermoleophilaceae bacterium]
MIHEAVFALAALWLTVLVLACLVVLVRSRSDAGRILALDTLVLMLIGLLVLWSASEAVSYFLDAALLLAALGFIGTLAAARFYTRGRLF